MPTTIPIFDPASFYPIAAVWMISSRVCPKMRTWIFLRDGSIFIILGMRNAPVLPEPLIAWKASF
jgi:hypothetical protein